MIAASALLLGRLLACGGGDGAVIVASPEASPAARSAISRAVLIAPDLNEPRIDAEASIASMREALTARGFQIPDHLVLTGEAATAAGIRAALRGAMAGLPDRTAADRLIIYYIGHGGYRQELSGLTVPAVTTWGGAMLPVDELLAEADAVWADALILDACMVSPSAIQRAGLSVPRHRTVLLTSASPLEPARADAAVGGLYTEALVQAMGARGGLIAAHALAAERLAHEPPTRGGRVYTQRPSLYPGVEIAEIPLGDTSADPALLLDGLTPLLLGTGYHLVVAGRSLDGSGVREVPTGALEVRLYRESETVARRQRVARPGYPVGLTPTAIAGAPPESWMTFVAAEAPVSPELVEVTAAVGLDAIDCETVESFTLTELDGDEGTVELFVTCRRESDHPRWLVADRRPGARFEDRSSLLGLDALGWGGAPGSLDLFGDGVIATCYVEGPGTSGHPGPLRCVGPDGPLSLLGLPALHLGVPRAADFDLDGAPELLLWLDGRMEIWAFDQGRFQRQARVREGDLSGNRQVLRLDSDRAPDLLVCDEEQLSAHLNTPPRWVSSAGLPAFTQGVGALQLVKLGPSPGAW